MNADELRKLADGIPQSDWSASGGHVRIAESENWPAIDINLRAAANRLCSPRLSRFIAAANPKRVLELLDQLAALQAQNTELAKDAATLSAQQIEDLAVEHEAFGFGRVDAHGFTTHGFDPDGIHAFAVALLKLAGSKTVIAAMAQEKAG